LAQNRKALKNYLTNYHKQIGKCARVVSGWWGESCHMQAGYSTSQWEKVKKCKNWAALWHKNFAKSQPRIFCSIKKMKQSYLVFGEQSNIAVAQCLSTGCIVHLRVCQDFSGVYHS